MFGVNSSFVQGIEVMDNMHDLRALEEVPVAFNFDVGRDEATEPVVGDNS